MNARPTAMTTKHRRGNGRTPRRRGILVAVAAMTAEFATGAPYESDNTMVKQNYKTGSPFLASGGWRWQYVAATAATAFGVRYFWFNTSAHCGEPSGVITHENHFPLVWRR